MCSRHGGGVMSEAGHNQGSLGDDHRKQRLEKLLDLAAMYRGWSKRRLGEELSRDESKLVPSSGNPKIDLLMGLSELLDWPVGDLVETLWDGAAPKPAEVYYRRSFDDLDQECVRLHDAGKYRERIAVAQYMHTIAATGRERAIAKFREYGGWEGLGRYSKCVDVLREALKERGLATTTRALLQSNLAWAMFAQCHVDDALSIARSVLIDAEELKAHTLSETALGAIALAHEVMGLCCRALVATDELAANKWAYRGVEAFNSASDKLHAQHDTSARLASYFDAKCALVDFCRMELQVFLGQRDATSCVAEILRAVVEVPRSVPTSSAEWADAECWGCIVGCTIALRHLPDREKSRVVAVLCEKGYELADRRDNWMLRQRIFEIDHSLRGFESSALGVDRDWVLDRDDVRVLVGTMGRYEGFRAKGWAILNGATIVKEPRQ